MNETCGYMFCPTLQHLVMQRYLAQKTKKAHYKHTMKSNTFFCSRSFWWGRPYSCHGALLYCLFDVLGEFTPVARDRKSISMLTQEESCNVMAFIIESMADEAHVFPSGGCHDEA